MSLLVHLLQYQLHMYIHHSEIMNIDNKNNADNDWHWLPIQLSVDDYLQAPPKSHEFSY